MIRSRPRLLATVMLAALLAACASSEQKQPRPELIEQADKTISSGVYNYNQTDYVKAEEMFTKALYRYRGIDSPEGIASSCINLAKTRLSQGDADGARQWIDIAHNIIESGGLNQLRNHVIIVRSSIAIETQEYNAAIQLLAPLLDDADKTIDKPTRLAALQNRTRIAFAENSEAATWTERYARQVTANEPLHQARLARFHAALATDDEIGDAQFNAALAIYRSQAHRPGIAATLSEWAKRDIEQQQYNNAENKLERALFIRAEMMDTRNCKEILDLYARLYMDTGNQAALISTRHWIKLIDSSDFTRWRELAEAYSSFPDSDI